jgi:hypothetical protein
MGHGLMKEDNILTNREDSGPKPTDYWKISRELMALSLH